MGSYVEGREVRDMQRLAPRVLAGVLPRLYPQMLELAYAHQDAGRPVYICTAASQEMANALSYILGFDGAIGSRSEILDGVYTGREGGLFAYREEKAQAIRELAAAEGIELSSPRMRTRTPSPTSRCCEPWATPLPSTPIQRSPASPATPGWEVLRFDRLHRRLKIGAALAAAAGGRARRLGAAPHAAGAAAPSRACAAHGARRRR